MKEKYVVEIFIDSQQKFRRKEIEILEDLVGNVIGFCFDLIDNPDKQHLTLICNLLLEEGASIQEIHEILELKIKNSISKQIKFQTRWTMVDALPSKTFVSVIGGRNES